MSQKKKYKRLTQDQRQEVKRLYDTGKYSMPRLAIKFGVHRDTIVRIVNPKFAEQARVKSLEYYYRKKEQNSTTKYLFYKEARNENIQIQSNMER